LIRSRQQAHPFGTARPCEQEFGSEGLRSGVDDLENSGRENYSFVVVIESIRKFNHAVPFVPYEIRTVSGETYEIPHPDFILMPPRGSYVVVIDPKDPKEAPNHISAMLIERATPLDSQQRRKTRKRPYWLLITKRHVSPASGF
jgi:hypothetical protein